MEGPGERPAGFPSARLHRGRLEGPDGQRGSRPISNLRTNAGSGSDATCRCPSPPIPNRTPGRGAAGHCLRHPHRMRDLIFPLCRGPLLAARRRWGGARMSIPIPLWGRPGLDGRCIFRSPSPAWGAALPSQRPDMCPPYAPPLPSPTGGGHRVAPPCSESGLPALSRPRQGGEPGRAGSRPSRGTPCFLPPDAVKWMGIFITGTKAHKGDTRDAFPAFLAPIF